MLKIFSKVDENKLLHIISKNLPINQKRQDLTKIEMPLQVSRINLKDTIVKPHSNNKKLLNSKLVEQNECWIVLKGIINISLFDIDKTNLDNLILNQGEILITCGGGHSINKSSDDAEMIEIKLGPYEKGNNLIYYEE
jgi:hypothetical protein|tara:strand:+ start:65 stop:478 length:414 start_codon:yes stop_codon:yes gene_type:complete